QAAAPPARPTDSRTACPGSYDTGVCGSQGWTRRRCERRPWETSNNKLEMWCQGPVLAAFEQRSRGRTPRSKRGAENAQSTGKVQSAGPGRGPNPVAAANSVRPAVMQLQKLKANS